MKTAEFMLARLFTTMLFSAALFVIGYYMGENRGYGMARDECKPVKAEVPLKQMTHKQQLKVIKWSMRDKGAIK